MCTDDIATAHLHQPEPQVLHDFEPRVVFGLEPVDSVTVTMLMDNVTDAFMPDQGPAHRPPLPVFHGGRRPRPPWKVVTFPRSHWPMVASRSWWMWPRTVPATESSSTPAPPPM